jgi:hypothetical protein
MRLHCRSALYRSVLCRSIFRAGFHRRAIHSGSVFGRDRSGLNSRLVGAWSFGTRRLRA